jgi:phage terminase small subunit
MTHSENIAAAIAKGDDKRVYDLLSVRQRRFCEEYIIDFEGKAAAIRAGYAPKWADRQAHELLNLPGVAYYVDSLTRSKENKIVSVNPDYVIQRVMDIIGKDGAKDGDKLRGLELLARHLGMFVDRTEISGPDGGAIETRHVEEQAQNFTNLLRQLADRAKKEEPSPAKPKTDKVR